MKANKEYSVTTFFLLTYLITWGIQFPMAALKIDIGTPTGRALNILAIFGPALAALILSYRRGGRAGLGELLSGFSRWKVGWIWYAAALLIPYVIMATALGANAALGGMAPVLGNSGVLLAAFVQEWLRILIFGGPLGEELGWRGYALPRLQARRSAARASLILGLVWGLWHLPSYFIPGTGQFEITQSGQFWFSLVGFLAWTIALSILFTWLYNNSSGSLLIVLLFHTAVNSAANLPYLLQVSGGAVSMFNVILTWVAAVLALTLTGPARLRRLLPGESSG